MESGSATIVEATRAPRRTVRLAALADVHCGKNSQGALNPIFRQAAEQAEIFVLCGDLTDHGLPEEAQMLVRELGGSQRPIVGVLGNHDYESGHADEVKRILTDAGMTMLDGEACEIQGVGFAGVKGFAGGFDTYALQPWGEEGIKRFVREAVDEALKLESALARLRTAHRIALLHYAPILATIDGEPKEILPFLGSSRLEEPLNHYPVTAAFHGHAHHGAPEGRTRANVPVYNVALPLLRRAFPDRPPFRLMELELPQEEAT